MRLELGDAADLGERLDRVLVAALRARGHALTRSQLARSFAAGSVRVAGVSVRPSLRVEGALTVDLELPRPPPLARAEPEAIALAIVHEDEQLLVVDKPAGMVVHVGPGHERGTLVNAVLHHLGAAASALPVLPGNGPERPGIVHRLDRDTSGLLVVAKTAAAQAALAAQFREHSIDRAYLGVVLGVPSWTRRRMVTGHGRDPEDRRRFRPEGPRQAVTECELIRPLGRRAALLRFSLETGRTHQIRMHARALGHPIFADALYGYRLRDPQLRRLAEGLGRHALHAALLGFDHPDRSRGRLRLEAPLPPELASLVAALEACVDS